MINHSHARSMAEACWGRGGTTSHRTNRRGAFYFSCSGHGGFIIDGDVLTDEEKVKISKYIPPTETIAYVDPNGNTRTVFNPFAIRSRRYRVPINWTRTKIEIFTAEEDCDWCIPAIFAGITLRKSPVTKQQSWDSFVRWRDPSAHEKVAAFAALSSSGLAGEIANDP